MSPDKYWPAVLLGGIEFWNFKCNVLQVYGAQEHAQDWKVSGSPHSQLSGEIINIQQIWNNIIRETILHRFSDIPQSGENNQAMNTFGS